MRKHLIKFSTDAERIQYSDSEEYVEPFVSLVAENGNSYYNKHDYSNDYLTFVILEDGTVTFEAKSSSVPKTISYSIDSGETWSSLTTSTTPQSLGGELSAGSEVWVKGNNDAYGTTTFDNCNKFGGTAKVNVCGNIMSLIYGDNFIGNSTLTTNGTFACLFQDCINLISAKNLILPSTTLRDYCYTNLFRGCTSLIEAPSLPAVGLAQYCYSLMFYNCTSLAKAPKLPALAMAQYCYNSMFGGCTSLTKAPELPATFFARNCYGHMFEDCTSLTEAPDLPVTTLVKSCYYGMFANCTALVKAPVLSATTLVEFCYCKMFSGCTSLTTAPELPATTLENSCYEEMFKGCSSLNYIKAMFTTEPSISYTSDWVNGVSATGTFVKNSDAEWEVTGANGIPEGWTVETAN